LRNSLLKGSSAWQRPVPTWESYRSRSPI